MHVRMYFTSGRNIYVRTMKCTGLYVCFNVSSWNMCNCVCYRGILLVDCFTEILSIRVRIIVFQVDCWERDYHYEFWLIIDPTYAPNWNTVSMIHDSTYIHQMFEQRASWDMHTNNNNTITITTDTYMHTPTPTPTHTNTHKEMHKHGQFNTKTNEYTRNMCHMYTSMHTSQKIHTNTAIVDIYSRIQEHLTYNPQITCACVTR